MPDEPTLTDEVIAEGLKLAAEAEEGGYFSRASLKWLDHALRYHKAALRQLRAQAAELERLRIQYERDQSAYALMQQGMESQAELMDGLKQDTRKLAAFKTWVHDYLDGKGVPTHPDGPHSREGCRVGDRMDAVFAQIEAHDRELERTRAWIEERAGERHLLHSSPGKESRFWGCSRLPCKQASAFLRGLTRFRCKAREAGTAGGNDPQDCDWPWCGCYPEATKVLEAVEESGRFVDRRELERLVAERDAAKALAKRLAVALQRSEREAEECASDLAGRSEERHPVLHTPGTEAMVAAALADARAAELTKTPLARDANSAGLRALATRLAEACVAARSFGCPGDTHEGISVSYIIDTALADARAAGVLPG